MYYPRPRSPTSPLPINDILRRHNITIESSDFLSCDTRSIEGSLFEGLLVHQHASQVLTPTLDDLLDVHITWGMVRRTGVGVVLGVMGVVSHVDRGLAWGQLELQGTRGASHCVEVRLFGTEVCCGVTKGFWRDVHININ